MTAQISFFSTGAADSSVLSSLTVDILAKQHFSVDIAPKSSQTTCEGKPRAELQAAQKTLSARLAPLRCWTFFLSEVFSFRRSFTLGSLYYVGLGSFSVL